MYKLLLLIFGIILLLFLLGLIIWFCFGKNAESFIHSSKTKTLTNFDPTKKTCSYLTNNDKTYLKKLNASTAFSSFDKLFDHVKGRAQPVEQPIPSLNVTHWATIGEDISIYEYVNKSIILETNAKVFYNENSQHPVLFRLEENYQTNVSSPSSSPPTTVDVLSKIVQTIKELLPIELVWTQNGNTFQLALNNDNQLIFVSDTTNFEFKMPQGKGTFTMKNIGNSNSNNHTLFYLDCDTGFIFTYTQMPTNLMLINKPGNKTNKFFQYLVFQNEFAGGRVGDDCVLKNLSTPWRPSPSPSPSSSPSSLCDDDDSCMWDVQYPPQEDAQSSWSTTKVCRGKFPQDPPQDGKVNRYKGAQAASGIYFGFNFWKVMIRSYYDSSAKGDEYSIITPLMVQEHNNSSNVTDRITLTVTKSQSEMVGQVTITLRTLSLDKQCLILQSDNRTFALQETSANCSQENGGFGIDNRNQLFFIKNKISYPVFFLKKLFIVLSEKGFENLVDISYVYAKINDPYITLYKCNGSVLEPISFSNSQGGSISQLTAKKFNGKKLISPSVSITTNKFIIENSNAYPPLDPNMFDVFGDPIMPFETNVTKTETGKEGYKQSNSTDSNSCYTVRSTGDGGALFTELIGCEEFVINPQTGESIAMKKADADLLKKFAGEFEGDVTSVAQNQNAIVTDGKGGAVDPSDGKGGDVEVAVHYSSVTIGPLLNINYIVTDNSVVSNLEFWSRGVPVRATNVGHFIPGGRGRRLGEDRGSAFRKMVKSTTPMNITGINSKQNGIYKQPVVIGILSITPVPPSGSKTGGKRYLLGYNELGCFLTGSVTPVYNQGKLYVQINTEDAERSIRCATGVKNPGCTENESTIKNVIPWGGGYLSYDGKSNQLIQSSMKDAYAPDKIDGLMSDWIVMFGKNKYDYAWIKLFLKNYTKSNNNKFQGLTWDGINPPHLSTEPTVFELYQDEMFPPSGSVRRRLDDYTDCLPALYLKEYLYLSYKNNVWAINAKTKKNGQYQTYTSSLPTKSLADLKSAWDNMDSSVSIGDTIFPNVQDHTFNKKECYGGEGGFMFETGQLNLSQILNDDTIVKIKTDEAGKDYWDNPPVILNKISQYYYFWNRNATENSLQFGGKVDDLLSKSSIPQDNATIDDLVQGLGNSQQVQVQSVQLIRADQVKRSQLGRNLSIPTYTPSGGKWVNRSTTSNLLVEGCIAACKYEYRASNPINMNSSCAVIFNTNVTLDPFPDVSKISYYMYNKFTGVIEKTNENHFTNICTDCKSCCAVADDNTGAGNIYGLNITDPNDLTTNDSYTLWIENTKLFPRAVPGEKAMTIATENAIENCAILYSCDSTSGSCPCWPDPCSCTTTSGSPACIGSPGSCIPSNANASASTNTCKCEKGYVLQDGKCLNCNKFTRHPNMVYTSTTYAYPDQPFPQEFLPCSPSSSSGEGVTCNTGLCVPKRNDKGQIGKTPFLTCAYNSEDGKEGKLREKNDCTGWADCRWATDPIDYCKQRCCDTKCRGFSIEKSTNACYLPMANAVSTSSGGKGYDLYTSQGGCSTGRSCSL